MADTARLTPACALINTCLPECVDYFAVSKSFWVYFTFCGTNLNLFAEKKA
jgi:hypothetical protein